MTQTGMLNVLYVIVVQKTYHPRVKESLNVFVMEYLEKFQDKFLNLETSLKPLWQNVIKKKMH